MSAQECQQPTCPGCPLMVSRDGKESFCARCDGGAKVGLPRPGLVDPLASSLSSTVKNQTRASSPTSSRDGESADLLADLDTAPNTPPTPQSHLPSPPLPQEIPVSTVDPVQAAARREQSDRASHLIGQRLLQGWALLDAQCTNDNCYAVPLMRRPAQMPKRSDSKQEGDNKPAVKKVVDPRRHCVICSRDYLKEGEVDAYEEFVQATQGKSGGLHEPSTSKQPLARTGNQEERVTHSAAAKKRRFSTQPGSNSLRPKAATSLDDILGQSKGKQRATEMETLPVPSIATFNPSLASAAPVNSSVSAMPSTSKAMPTHQSGSANAAAVAALEKAVRKLSQHLESVVEQDIGGDNHGPAAVADAAEALARTCLSLQNVANL